MIMGMTVFTVKIEACDPRGEIWQAVAPAESVDTSDWGGHWGAYDVAKWVAGNQTVATGDGWRVSVWKGADADEGTAPDARVYAEQFYAGQLL